MKRKQKPWSERKDAVIAAAQAKRLQLLQLLAPDCRCDGCKKYKRSYVSLEIDHADGNRTWEARKLNRWSRIAHYWRDYHAGVPLRALCRKCNGKDGRARQLQMQYAERAMARKQTEFYLDLEARQAA